MNLVYIDKIVLIFFSLCFVECEQYLLPTNVKKAHFSIMLFILNLGIRKEPQVKITQTRSTSLKKVCVNKVSKTEDTFFYLENKDLLLL